MLKKIKSGAREWVYDRMKSLSKNKGTKKLTMCKKCYTFYYKRSWHFYRPKEIDLSRDEEIPVRFTECTACLEQEDAFYEADPSFDMLAR
jgi:hypothetical protein